MIQDMFQVGAITSTHGLKGEVKVFPTTDDVNRFKKCKELLLDTGRNGMITLYPESCKFFKQFVILKFKGLDRIEDVELYKGKSLYVTRENAVKLKKDEYFIADMIGMKVIDENEVEIGELTDVMPTGANDVYVINCKSGKELLLPAIKECVLNVDIEGGILQVHILDGLMDD